jgi:hypothetical protein
VGARGKAGADESNPERRAAGLHRLGLPLRTRHALGDSTDVAMK